MAGVSDERVLLLSVLQHQQLREVSLQLRELLVRTSHDFLPLEDQVVQEVDGRPDQIFRVNFITIISSKNRYELFPSYDHFPSKYFVITIY